MQLTLKYNEHATQVLSGAFIRGNTPDIWLQEINAWQIPLQKLVCFIIAQNNDQANAAGLFVLFSKEQMPNVLQVRQPYSVLGDKLYIPIDAELSPAISKQELQTLLIWDYQVFHPTIGFIGFEKTDRIDLADLLQYSDPRNIYWGYARPGQTPWVPLSQINVAQLTADEFFDSFKKQISNKPLEDIPKSNKKEVPAWLNNPIASGLFNGAFTILSGVGALIPAGSFSENVGSKGGQYANAAGSEKRPGLFKKIMNWMEEKIEDLEKQRDSELKRLSDLFEKNSDEALQYAIPLNSPYLNRGQAAPSAHLTKRSTQFNMGQLGGGRAVDGWNVDCYYEDLRKKYLKAAQKAIEEKDFKKATYIYAHLLGDFTTAADTLRRGKHYREASVLYREHLKNLSMAAICLEEGGMFPEAIEIYTELNQHEKAGDLYRELGQQESALGCYEKCVLAAAANRDFLEQSRIIVDKIADKPRAKKVLLSGWQDVKQPEACLVKYFDLVADDNKEQLPPAVKTFYTSNQAANKEMAFLHVIEKVNQKHKTTELENTCQGIAYEIVSEQVNAGNPDSLYALKNFVPGDQLLTPDCHRFMNTFENTPKQKPGPSQWQLMNEVQWKKTTVWQNQLLAWGTKPSGMTLARMNWEGYIEYFSWHFTNERRSSLYPMVDPTNTNRILLYGFDESLTEKRLPMNKHFQDELIVAGFTTYRILGVCMHNGEVAVFQRHPDSAAPLLSRYSLKGKSLEAVSCTFTGAVLGLTRSLRSEMFWCNEHFYTSCEQAILQISKEGEIEILYPISEPVRKIAVNSRQDGLVNVAVAFEDRVSILTVDENDEYYCEPYEIRGIMAVDMTFLPNGHLVLAGKGEVQVLNSTSWELQWNTKTEYVIMSIFPGPNRDQIGILESTGKITLHKFRE